MKKKVDAKKFLTTSELAKRWAMSAGTLKNWRSLKRGPRYLKYGKTKNGKAMVRYSIDVIMNYERMNLHG